MITGGLASSLADVYLNIIEKIEFAPKYVNIIENIENLGIIFDKRLKKLYKVIIK